MVPFEQYCVVVLSNAVQPELELLLELLNATLDELIATEDEDKAEELLSLLLELLNATLDELISTEDEDKAEELLSLLLELLNATLDELISAEDEDETEELLLPCSVEFGGDETSSPLEQPNAKAKASEMPAINRTDLILFIMNLHFCFVVKINFL